MARWSVPTRWAFWAVEQDSEYPSKDRHGAYLHAMRAGGLTAEPLDRDSPFAFPPLSSYASRLSPLAFHLSLLPSPVSRLPASPLPQMHEHSGPRLLAGRAGGQERIRVRRVIDHLLAASPF